MGDKFKAYGRRLPSLPYDLNFHVYRKAGQGIRQTAQQAHLPDPLFFCFAAGSRDAARSRFAELFEKISDFSVSNLYIFGEVCAVFCLTAHS